MWNKIIALCLFSGIFLFACNAYAQTVKPCTPAELKALIPAKVATINGKTIDQHEFYSYLMRQLPKGKIPGNLNQKTAPYVLAVQAEQMIIDLLIKEYLKTKKVLPSSTQVTTFYHNQVQKLTPDEKALLEARLQRNKKTIEDWISQKAADPEIQDQVAAFEFFEKEYTAKIQIAEKQISDYYHKNNTRFNVPETATISHIRFLFDPRKKGTREAALQKARKVAAAVKKNPKSFAAVAAKESDCPSRTKGGKLGTVERNMLHKNVEKTVFSMKAGTISDPLESHTAFHIVLCEARTPARKYAYHEVKAGITDMLKRQEAQKRLEQLVADLKKKNKVRIFLTIPHYQAYKMEIPADARPR